MQQLLQKQWNLICLLMHLPLWCSMWWIESDCEVESVFDLDFCPFEKPTQVNLDREKKHENSEKS